MTTVSTKTMKAIQFTEYGGPDCEDCHGEGKRRKSLIFCLTFQVRWYTMLEVKMKWYGVRHPHRGD